MISCVWGKRNMSSKTVIWSVDALVSWAKWGNGREELTLDNMGDHQRSAAVVAGQTSTGNILFDLEGKQVPGRKHKQLSEIQQSQRGGGGFQGWSKIKWNSERREFKGAAVTTLTIKFNASWLFYFSQKKLGQVHTLDSGIKKLRGAIY